MKKERMVKYKRKEAYRKKGIFQIQREKRKKRYMMRNVLRKT